MAIHAERRSILAIRGVRTISTDDQRGGQDTVQLWLVEQLFEIRRGCLIVLWEGGASTVAVSIMSVLWRVDVFQVEEYARCLPDAKPLHEMLVEICLRQRRYEAPRWAR